MAAHCHKVESCGEDLANLAMNTLGIYKNLEMSPQLKLRQKNVV